METIEIEGGEILASLEERTITGLLVPYNEIGRTNVGMFEVTAGVLDIPTDPSVVSLNIDHDRYQPVGRATRIWEEPRGIMATFSIGNTPAGDAALADARDPNGKRRRLSGEFRTGIKDGKATGGPLAAGALVPMGAFQSAMVLAQAADTIETTTAIDPEPITTTTEEQEGTVVPENTETVQATAVVPPTYTPPAEVTPRPIEKAEILAALATVKWGVGGDVEKAEGVLAALSDIKITGTGALPAAGLATAKQSWLGLIDLGVPYVREYLPLAKTGTDISAFGKKGYKMFRGPASSPTYAFPNDGTWTGNKTEINTGTGHTTLVESTLDKYARGVDIAREYFDLPGGADVIEAFLAEMVLDHLQWSDEKARALIVATAGTPIAPAVYPGVDGHDYAGAMGQLIQGILAVKRRKFDGRRDVPTFAIANELAYEELVYTPKDLVPEFVTFNVNTDGRATADGKVVVVQGDTGVEDTASVIVGADYAIEFDELPGGPLRVDAVDLVKGGIDRAIHGYLQKFVARPEAIVHIGTADV